MNRFKDDRKRQIEKLFGFLVVMAFTLLFAGGVLNMMDQQAQRQAATVAALDKG